MRVSERRVVITGQGLITPIGIGPDALWSALAEGQGAVGRITAFPVAGLPTEFGAEVKDFDPRALAIPAHKKAFAKSLKYMARDIQLAVAAAELAVSDAGLASGAVDPTRVGLDLGAGLISSDLDELAEGILPSFDGDGSFDYRTYGREGIPKITPIWLLKYLPNMLACHISILCDCQGPSNTITEGEAASILALGEAARIIARNRADVMISGGADSKIHPMSLIRAAMMNQLTRWDGPPEQAVKPFDKHRDGWAPGEGAGIIVLEEREHALKRGATILAEVLGFGAGSDATAEGGLDPNGAGAAIALRAALHDAGLAPRDVGHVNAHGAATVASDLAESRAIRDVFGRDAAVTAQKGYFGNIASGGGSVELAASLTAVRRGFIPPTLNCDNQDPACEIDVVAGEPRRSNNPVFAKLSFTRLGQAAAIIIRAEA